jgi:hypothetical protein
MQEQPATVFLIHGTFAGATDQYGSAWWQTGGEFRRRLATTGPEPVGSFQWDVGDNRESIRRLYGEKLRNLVVELEREKRPYAFIAHSHGGSVLWHGLFEAEAEFAGLPRLQRWVTVGTPFLHGAPEWGLMVWLLPFAVSFLGIVILAKDHALNYWALRYDLLLSFETWLHVPIWTVVLALSSTALLSGTSMTRAIINAAKERARKQRMLSAYTRIGDRHQILTAGEDEAVVALSLTTAFDGILLPASGLFTPVSRVLDRILWRRASRAAQGSDILGVRIHHVSAAPVDRPCPNMIPPSCEKSLSEIAKTNFGERSGQVRRSLRQAVFVEPVRQIGDILDKVDVTDGLIHTSYFRDPQTMDVIMGALRRPMAQEVEQWTSNARLSSRTDAWLHLWFAVSLTLVLWTGFQGARMLLRPFSITAMVLSEIAETIIGDGAFADPTEPYEIFRSLAATGNLAIALQRTRDLQSAEDRSLALAYIIAGTEEHRKESAAPLWNRIAMPAPQMGLGTHGPPRSESFADYAMMRVLGRSGKLNLALERLKERVADSDWRQLNGAVRNLGYGLAEGGHFDQLAELFSRREVDESVRLAAWEKVVQGQPPCNQLEALLQTFKAESEEDALAAGMSYVARCKGLGAAVEIATELHRAVPRLRAAIVLGGSVRDQKPKLMALLGAALASFPTLPRSPAEGRAEHLAAAAGTYLDLKEPQETRRLLTSIENLPKELERGDLWDDNSPPDRAMVWARLGDTSRAIEWWKKARTVARMSDEGDWYALLQRITTTAIIAGGIQPTLDSVRAPNTSESAETVAGIRIELGKIAARRSVAPIEAGRLLQLASFRATPIYDPSQRSAILRDIGFAYLEHGFPRLATATARRCQPKDRLYLLAAVLRWRPDGANAHFVPLIDPDE